MDTSRRGLIARSVGLVPALLLTGGAVALDLPHPSRPGPNPDYPPFVAERNGIKEVPWGAGNYRWPEQLFWESMSQVDNKHLEMLQATRGVESQGRVPILSCVAWGYEYAAATGGDSSAGFADMSHREGWQQWGEWIKARESKYLALDWEGKVYYPSAGYITPLMPFDSADWPPGMRDATFGDFAGWKLGTLANRIEARGFFAADFVVGLYGGNHDFHPRVVDDFQKWSGLTVPGTSVKERADWIKANAWSVWNDFKSDRFARFYARAARTIAETGREPQVGGQILPHAASVRSTGNDFRIYLKHLPAKNWYFQVELQSDEGRPVPPYWKASTNMGGHAGRVPEMPLGAHMDAWQSNFRHAVENAGKDTEWARLYLKHAWLTTGWTHVANLDGSVRRAPQAFQRGYWDQAVVDTPVVALMRAHIPRHPFGPAFYWSTDLERQSESTGNPNFWWWFEPKVLGWRSKGVPGGYFVCDSALANLPPENRPTGWYVYVDNLGKTHLSEAERVRLERIAPILEDTDVRDSLPLSFEGDSLGGFGFIDQNGSVIVVVSNSSETEVQGSMHFAKVEDGQYPIRDLLGYWSGWLPIQNHKGRLPLKVAARDTRVFEIPGLREQGRGNLIPRQTVPWIDQVGSWRNQPRRDALGRITRLPTWSLWSVPAR
ncbi:MAG: hypothetical protein H6686_00230 [Fibrobacteria bacterium]|nr:hypothetical protein [Fibrobacteria bacterium]